jgi:hypothetical protein
MPQPLSRVKKDAIFYLSAGAATDKPILAAKVARCIALAAHIENLLAGILTTMLGAQAKPAAAMLRSLHSLGVKSQAIKAAAEEALSPDLLDLFTVIMGLCDKAADHRHRFVHWSWAQCDQLPDALLFIDPKALLSHEVEAAGFMYPNEGRGFYDDIDKRRVLVYRAGSLDRAVTALVLANDKLAAFRLCVIPHPDAMKANAEIYRRLVSAPDVAPKLEVLRAQRTGSQAE